MTQPFVFLRSSESYRREARAVLRGKWKPVLIVGVILALIGGALIGPAAGISDAQQMNRSYSVLTITLGPLTSETYWQGAELVMDAADQVSAPGLVPLNADFLTILALAALIFTLLAPVYTLGMTRLTMRLHAGEKITAAVLRTGWKDYWRMAKTLLLTLFVIEWLPALFLIGGIALAFLAPGAFALSIALLITAVVLNVTRLYSYQLAPALSVVKPELSVREAVAESARLMKGHRFRLFSLGLSFIGWTLLLSVVSSLLLLPAQLLSLPVAALLAIDVLIGLLAVPLTIYQQTAVFGFLLDRAGLSTWNEPQVMPQPAPAPSEDDSWTDTTYRPFDQPSGQQTPPDDSGSR